MKNATRLPRKLSLLLLLNLAVMTVVSVPKPHDSLPQKLAYCLQGRLLADSSPFMQEAWRVAQLHLPVYPTVFFTEHLKFQYPTSSLLLGYLTVLLHVSWSTLVQWMVLVCGLLTLVIAGDVFVRLVPVEQDERWKCRLLVAGLGVTFYPLVLGVRFAQMQTVITLLFTLAVWLWTVERKAGAGVCLALACAIKPPLVLFLLWGLVRREWRFFWALLVTFGVVQLAAIGAFGWSNEVGYLAPLSYMAHHGECIGENQSVNGWLQRLLGNGEGSTTPFPPYNPVVYFGTVISSLLLIAGALVLPVWRRWRDPMADFMLFGLLSTIASPIVWTHHYGVFYVGCIYFCALALRQRGKLPWAFVVSYLLLANFMDLFGRHYWDRPFNLIFSTVLYGGLGVVVSICFQLQHNEVAAFGGLSEQAG